MTTPTPYVSPFAPLQLGPEDAQELEGTARVLVDELTQLYRVHLHENHGRVDLTRWKHVRQREHVHVYSERRSFRARVGGVGDGGPVSDNPLALPTLLTVGALAEDLDDIMYGVVNETLDAMRFKTSYVEDNIINAAVLATLVEPSLQEPFRSFMVKWDVIGRGPCVSAVVKNRDFIFLESTGMSQLENGERIGYQLLHSVKFPQLGELHETIRGNMSMCCVYRQKAPGTVELFMRGYLDPAGGLMRTVVIKSAADIMVSVWKNVYCAEMKKLAWAIRRRGAQGRNHAAEAIAMCTACQKHLRAGSPSRTGVCGVCCQRLCHSCRITKKLSFLGAGSKLIQEQLSFCTRCFTQVTGTSAVAVALDEIRNRDGYTHHSLGYSGDSHSSSSP